MRSLAYYEEQKAGLGLDFLSEVEEAVDKIQQKPNLGRAYKVLELCRYVIQRFPFLILYTEFEQFIWVVAIAYRKRRHGLLEKATSRVTGPHSIHPTLPTVISVH